MSHIYEHLKRIALLYSEHSHNYNGNKYLNDAYGVW